VRMCCMSRPTVLVSLLFYHYHTSLISPLLFFLTDPATPEIYTLSLHDALPIFSRCPSCSALISAVTGAPASLARLLGFHDLMKGTAAKPTPTAPTTAVVAVKNRRRPVLTGSFTPSLAIRHSDFDLSN